MSIIARFRCRSVSNIDSSHWSSDDDDSQFPRTEVDLRPVDSPDNVSWSQGKPNGGMDLRITVPAAATAFVPGGEYWVTFTPVIPQPKVQVGDTIQVPGVEDDHRVDRICDDGSIDISPVSPTDTQAAPKPLTTQDGTTIPAGDTPDAPSADPVAPIDIQAPAAAPAPATDPAAAQAAAA